MFDLIAFIRQLMPPQARQPVTIGLVRVLFTPAMAVLNAIKQAKADVLTSAGATGQVAVLEDLLNQATFGTGVGSVYILDGDQRTYDFQVLVPTGLSRNTLNTINDLLNTHKLKGKRYTLQTQVLYIPDSVVTPTTVTWVTGFPYLSGDRLHFAINERGTFRLKIVTGDQVLYDTDYTFGGASDDNYIAGFDPNSAYTIIVANLSKVVSNAPGNNQSQGLTKMGYSRDSATHQTTLWFVSDRLYKVSASLVSGSASGDGWQTDVARTLDGSISLKEYTKGLRFNPTANGSGGILASVTYYITITEVDGSKPFTVAWTPQTANTNGVIEIPLTPTTKPVAGANRPPVVATALASPTITDHGDQTLVIPPNTFADPDGDMLTLSATKADGSALPAGVTFDAPNRQFTVAESVPNQTLNLVVKASDPLGASVSVTYNPIVNRAAVVAPTPGSFDVVYADDNPGGGPQAMMQIAPRWRTDANGKNWVTLVDSATPNVSDPYHRYYLFDEDGAPNASVGWNPHTGRMEDFGEFPENYVVYIQMILAKGPFFTDYPFQNDNYKTQAGFAQVFTGTKP